jgi:hypothetical protein
LLQSDGNSQLYSRISILPSLQFCIDCWAAFFTTYDSNIVSDKYHETHYGTELWENKSVNEDDRLLGYSAV